MIQTTNTTLVSVIVPAYNAERWVGETLNSVLRQTHVHLEVIVIDDGSRDGTAAIVAELAKEDDRIQLVQQGNEGHSPARNHALRLASGDYVAPIDADDLWYPQKIEKQLERFIRAEAEGQRLGLVYCWSRSIDESGAPTFPQQGKVTEEGAVYDSLITSNFVGNGSSPMMPATLLREIGGYPADMTGGCEDWTVYLRIASNYFYGVVPEELVGYRQHPNSLSKDLHKMLSGHTLMLEHLRQSECALGERQIWQSRNSMLLWEVYRSLMSPVLFMRSLFMVHRVDPLFLLRKSNVCFFIACLFNKLKRGMEVVRAR